MKLKLGGAPEENAFNERYPHMAAHVPAGDNSASIAHLTQPDVSRRYNVSHPFTLGFLYRGFVKGLNPLRGTRGGSGAC